MRFLLLTVGMMLAIGLVPWAHAAPSTITAPSIATQGGIEGGINELENIVQPPVATNASGVRDVIVKIINFILSFLTLIAVIAIIVAGFLLILGFGSEASATRARKIIIYTIVGLIVIFFARVIVGFFTTQLPAQLP